MPGTARSLVIWCLSIHVSMTHVGTEAGLFVQQAQAQVRFVFFGMFVCSSSLLGIRLRRYIVHFNRNFRLFCVEMFRNHLSLCCILFKPFVFRARTKVIFLYYAEALMIIIGKGPLSLSISCARSMPWTL